MRTKLNAKVVWWISGSDGNPKRLVLGQRDAVAAWRLFYALRANHAKTGHIVAGPELWIGGKRILASGNTEKGLVLPLRV